MSRHPIGREPVRRAREAGVAEEYIDRPLPPGAIIIDQASQAFVLPDYVPGREWGDIDWDEVGWDDYEEDFGAEEEEVDYGGTEK